MSNDQIPMTNKKTEKGDRKWENGRIKTGTTKIQKNKLQMTNDK